MDNLSRILACASRGGEGRSSGIRIFKAGDSTVPGTALGAGPNSRRADVVRLTTIFMWEGGVRVRRRDDYNKVIGC